MKSISENKRIARTAGLWYLMVAVFSMYSILSGVQDMSVIVAGMLGQTAFLLTVLYLYKLFTQVDEHISKIMVAFVLVSIPITFSGLVFKAGAYASGRPEYLEIYDMVNTIVLIFWGLWLLPFAYLVYKSNFIPKIFAVLLALGGTCYCISCVMSLLSPELYAAAGSVLLAFETLGEIPILLWLLIKGVSNKA